MKKSSFFFLLIALFLGGCAKPSFSDTKDKIQRTFGRYAVYLNDKKIALDTIYLDKNNIKNIKINKIENYVRITQKNKNAEYFSVIDFLPPKEGACSNDRRNVVINKDTIISNGKLVKNITLRKIENSTLISVDFVRREHIYGNCLNGTLVITLK